MTHVGRSEIQQSNRVDPATGRTGLRRSGKRATGPAVEPRSGETRFAAQPRNAPATSEPLGKVAGSGEEAGDRSRTGERSFISGFSLW